MKNFFRSFFSMQLTIVLLTFFGISIAVATFIENDYGSAASKVWVYNATWFELLLAFLAVNLIGNLFEHKLWKRKRYLTFLMHVSFVIILIGAAITRFIGYEGTMHVREGESSDVMLSDATYITVEWNNHGNSEILQQKVLYSSAGWQASDFKLKKGKDKINIKTLAFVPDASAALTAVDDGEPIISLFALTNTSRETLILRQGDSVQVEDIFIAFCELDNKPGISLSIENGRLFASATKDIYLSSMGNQQSDSLKAGSIFPFESMKFYAIDNVKLVLHAFEPSGAIYPVPARNPSDGSGLDAVLLQIEHNQKTKEIAVWGKRGVVGEKTIVRNFDGGNLKLSFGSIPIKLPFSLYLNDFILDRYPGSNSPSSYKSEVTLIDKEKNMTRDFSIYMNHILTHRGYRFYQSSFDTDEKGTILSVNHDAPGTFVTYSGYGLMTLTMILLLLSKNSRFNTLIKELGKIRKQKAFLGVAILLAMISKEVTATTPSTEPKIVTETNFVKKEHADKFGRLIVLGTTDRLEPMNSLNNRILRKISGKTRFLGMNPDQIILEIMVNPEKWQKIPIIKLKNKELRNVINISGSMAAFSDFFNPANQGEYLLSNYIEQAYRKNPFERNQFDKDVISVDERLNIFFMLMNGHYLKLFPDINNPSARWYNGNEPVSGFPEEDSNFVKNIIPVYLESLETAIRTGKYDQADKFLEAIGMFQQKYAAGIIMPELKQNIEILYNKTGIFERLFRYYGLTGLIMLVILFANLVNPGFRIGLVKKLINSVLLLFFVFHTLGLIARWYISGHAPLSNGYESMIYIAWATMLAGFIFVRKSNVALAATSILASLTLFVAHLSWMNPEITNLLPVLKSVWLTVHVGVITASYGFLGLVMILGIINLIMMIFQTKNNHKRFSITIKEITLTSEMAMTVGLYLLTIGSFLGGIWANESWGRYWGWDPKETWSLVTIIVYTIVLHIGYIPGLKSLYLFNALSVVAFASVMMTYFGVNYYFSGLHSYAGGDPVPVPMVVYYSVFTVILLLVLASVNNQRIKSIAAEGTDTD